MLSKTDLYFLTIAETGNLNTAAEKLYVSQPSLSKYIHRLEHSLGAELFDRSSSPMKLNEAGKLYLQHLKESMEKEQQLRDQLQELNGEVRGTLRLGIPPYFGQCYLPKILPAFYREYPHVSIELHESNGSRIEQELAGQTIDLAILPHPIESEHLAYSPLLEESILLAEQRKPTECHTNTLEIQNADFDRFRGKPMILPTEEQKIGSLLTDYFSAIGYKPEVVIRTQNVTTTLSLAAEGLGIGFVPSAGLETISSAILQKLRFYTLTPSPGKLRFVSVTRKNTVPAGYSRRFLELFMEL